VTVRAALGVVAAAYLASAAAVWLKEAQALSDCCPKCFRVTKPVAVVQDPPNHGRVGAYRCRCGYDWLCWWLWTP
jgi:hypothetical protein